MKINTKTMIAGAAMAGLFTGTTARVHATSVSNQQAGKFLRQMDEVPDNHTCRGQNNCKGKGNCKTGDNGCKGKNSCKGKGGCKTETSK